MSCNNELSFVFPTFDEDINVINRLREIEAISDLINGQIEIIISDDTPHNNLLEKQLRKIKKKESLTIKYIHRNKLKLRRGLAFSIKDGLEASSGNYICVADVDGQHNIFDALNLYEKSKKFNRLVIGSRFIKGGGMGSFNHFLISLIFNLWLIPIISVPCLDKTGGFFVMPNDICQKLITSEYNIFSGYGDYFCLLYTSDAADE